MSTAGILAATTAAQVASNKARARIQCKLDMEGFHPDAATVVEIQHYTKCAQLLYPPEIQGSAPIGVKVAVALLIIGTFSGLIYAFRNRKHYMFNGVGGLMYGAFSGFLIVCIGLMIAFGLFLGLALIIQ